MKLNTDRIKQIVEKSKISSEQMPQRRESTPVMNNISSEVFLEEFVRTPLNIDEPVYTTVERPVSTAGETLKEKQAIIKGNIITTRNNMFKDNEAVPGSFLGPKVEVVPEPVVEEPKVIDKPDPLVELGAIGDPNLQVIEE